MRIDSNFPSQPTLCSEKTNETALLDSELKSVPSRRARSYLWLLLFKPIPKRARAHLSARHGVQRIAAFFLLFALLSIGLNVVINYGMHRITTSGYGVSNRVMGGKVNAEIVISGSSRALTHYESEIIEKITGFSTFNIGRNGAQTDMQLAYLKAYLNNNAKPKLVIHNLDLFSFQTSKEIFDPAQYMPYLDQTPIYDAIRKIYPDAWKWKYLPLYGYVAEDMRFSWLQGLKALLGINPQEDQIQGFQPRFTSWTGDFEKFRASHPDGVLTEMETQGVREIEELIELCRQQDVKVLLVYSPEYHEMQLLERNRPEIFQKIREICEKYNVPLWDYSDSPISLDRGWFYNSQHLNAQGARVFSSELAHRLIDTAELPVSDKGSSTVRR
jgi:hypothetical protein